MKAHGTQSGRSTTKAFNANFGIQKRVAFALMMNASGLDVTVE